MLSIYLAVLDDQSNEEHFIDVYNTYKRLVYHTAYKIMGDSTRLSLPADASDAPAHPAVRG